MLIIVLSAFLVGAVIYDLISHRLPNLYLLMGLLGGLLLQVWTAGGGGVMAFGSGLLAGCVLFIPFYVLGGMAAGDVKLMATVGSFVGMQGAFWAGAYSLIAGGVLGVVYLIYKGCFSQFVTRYLAMAATRSRIAAEEGDAARHRFPYAVAIAMGTLLSLYWTPI